MDVERLPIEHFCIYKNITQYTYIERDDIEKDKNKKIKEMLKEPKYFTTEEFRKFKKLYLKKNENSYGIPQGSAISSNLLINLLAHLRAQLELYLYLLLQLNLSSLM